MKRTIEQVPDIAYSIPYKWGQLSVSEQANEAYGLTPFTATVEGSNINDAPRPQSGPAAYLTLVGPREYGLAPVMPAKRPKSDRVASLSFALPVTREGMIDQLADEIGFIREHVDDRIDEVVGDDGKSLEETLENEVPQQIAHLLSVVAGKEVSKAITQCNLEIVDQKIARQVRNLGMLGITSTLMVLQVTHAIVPDRPGIMVGAAIGNAIGSSHFGARSIRDALRIRDTVQQNPLLGNIFGLQVANDIHASYCRNVFDSTQEEML